MQEHRFTATLGLVSAVLLAAPQAATAQQMVDAGKIDLETWSYAPLYEPDAWSVSDLFNAPVFDRTGTEIGEVEDLVFNDDGEVLALIAAVGGVWDFGDTHVSVPWDDVQRTDVDRVEVPVTEESIEDFDLFAFSGLPGTEMGERIVSGVDDEQLDPGIWRASDLIGDYVRVQDREDAWLNFGYVEDILLKDDEIAATIVNSTQPRGAYRYALPYYRPPVMASAPATDIPVLVGDVMAMKPFEAGRVGTGN